jgi:hypothetical protein
MGERTEKYAEGNIGGHDEVRPTMALGGGGGLSWSRMCRDWSPVPATAAPQSHTVQFGDTVNELKDQGLCK